MQTPTGSQNSSWRAAEAIFDSEGAYALNEEIAKRAGVGWRRSSRHFSDQASSRGSDRQFAAFDGLLRRKRRLVASRRVIRPGHSLELLV